MVDDIHLDGDGPGEGGAGHLPPAPRHPPLLLLPLIVVVVVVGALGPENSPESLKCPILFVR